MQDFLGFTRGFIRIPDFLNLYRQCHLIQSAERNDWCDCHVVNANVNAKYETITCANVGNFLVRTIYNNRKEAWGKTRQVDVIKRPMIPFLYGVPRNRHIFAFTLNHLHFTDI